MRKLLSIGLDCGFFGHPDDNPGLNLYETPGRSAFCRVDPKLADFFIHTMLLDLRALFLTIPLDFAWYLASFVQKLFTSKAPDSETEFADGLAPAHNAEVWHIPDIQIFPTRSD